jgi:hypothetical protein
MNQFKAAKWEIVLPIPKLLDFHLRYSPTLVGLVSTFSQAPIMLLSKLIIHFRNRKYVYLPGNYIINDIVSNPPNF